jgi:hypothetical protein
MQLSMATDGEVGVGTVFKRRHTHFGDPVEGSMTVIEFERDELLVLAVDDGNGEFFVRLAFEEAGESVTKVSSVVRSGSRHPDSTQRESWRRCSSTPRTVRGETRRQSCREDARPCRWSRHLRAF